MSTLGKAVRPGRAVQRVNVDFPVDLLREIDREARRLGVTRQAFIKSGWPTRSSSVSEPRSRLQRSNVDDAIEPVHEFLVLRRAIAEVLATLFEVTKTLFDAPPA